ncbi:TetR/AcrR family transcriptional regulator [Kitasatospora sp. NPDC059327]|uniref:TetR/AcrR family transcriptional regulator n=1 Tax=Kitasatospora sp. NPDC059327 TaxID=3346803 RepID=UPI003673E961
MSSTSGGGAGDTVRLLWGPHQKPSRGPKPALSLERIARAGIEIADAEGIGAVSMQRVAGLLDYTKMSLYRYVPGKAELVALMVEAAIGEQAPAGPGTAPDGGTPSPRTGGTAIPRTSGTAEGTPEAAPPAWRTELHAWARQVAETFGAHPWLLDATVGPRVPGPRELAWLEQVVACLDGTGLTGPERMDTAVLLAGHVRGISEQVRAAGPAGRPESEMLAVLGGLVQEHAERFPALAVAMTERDGRDQAMEFGLERILDGLAALIARRSG